MKMMGKDV
jgi:hypothetical protein